MTFARRLPLVVSVAIVALLAGCGGDGGGGGSKPKAGHFEGFYNGVDTGYSGSVSLDLAADGKIEGTASDTRYPRGTVEGRREANGDTTLTITWTLASTGTFVRTSIGTLVEADGRLTGTLQEQGDQNPMLFNYTLTLVQD